MLVNKAYTSNRKPQVIKVNTKRKKKIPKYVDLGKHKKPEEIEEEKEIEEEVNKLNVNKKELKITFVAE